MNKNYFCKFLLLFAALTALPMAIAGSRDRGQQGAAYHRAAKADLELPTKLGHTPLILASRLGNFADAKRLIAKGATLNKQDENGMTAFMWAINMNYTNIALLLIEANADLELSDKTGETPLIRASKLGNLTNAKRLIEKGVDLNKQDNQGMTALLWAIDKGYTDIALLLIKAKANLELPDKRGYTPLILASIAKNLTVVKRLIEKCADLNKQDNQGMMALLWAIDMNHTDIALLLIKAKADLELAGKTGDTPLIRASKLGNLTIVKQLIDKGAHLDKQDEKGYTALMHTVDLKNTELVKTLLDFGADKTLQDNKGLTAYQYAMRRGFNSIATLLKKNRKKLNKKQASTASTIQASSEEKLKANEQKRSQRRAARQRRRKNKRAQLSHEQTKSESPGAIEKHNRDDSNQTGQVIRSADVAKDDTLDSLSAGSAGKTLSLQPKHPLPKNEQKEKEPVLQATHALLDDFRTLAKLLGEKPGAIAENGRSLFLDIIIKASGTKGSAEKYQNILRKLVGRTKLLEKLLYTLSTTSQEDGHTNIFHAVALLDSNNPHLIVLFDTLKDVIKKIQSNEANNFETIQQALNQTNEREARPLEIAENECTKAYLQSLGASATTPSSSKPIEINASDDEKQDEMDSNAGDVQENPQMMFEQLLKAVQADKGKVIRLLITRMIARGFRSIISRQMRGGKTLLHSAVERGNLEAVVALTARYEDISMLPQARTEARAKRKKKKKSKIAMSDDLILRFNFDVKDNNGLISSELAQKIIQETPQASPEYARRKKIAQYLTDKTNSHQAILAEQLTASTFSDPVSQFHTAVQANNVQRVKTLLSQNPKLVNIPDPTSNLSALEYAAQRNNVEMMALLISNGAQYDTSIRNVTCKTRSKEEGLSTDLLVQLDQALTSSTESYNTQSDTWNRLCDHVRDNHFPTTLGGNTDRGKSRFDAQLLGADPRKALLLLVTSARNVMLKEPKCVQHVKRGDIQSDHYPLFDHEVGLHEAWIIPARTNSVKAAVVATIRNGYMRIVTMYPLT